MTIRKMTLYFFMICTLLLVAACGHETEVNNVKKPGDVEPPLHEEIQQVMAIEKGEIVSINGNNVLVTAYIDRGDDSYVEAYSLNMTEKTELLDREGSTVTRTELVVGAQVEAWYDGPLQESFPGGAHAAKLILLTNDQEQMNIDRSEAVRIALKAQTELATWAVKKAEKDASNEFWHVELVHFEHIKQPVEVLINAKSGVITQVPKMENEAFRVYTPEAAEELGNVFVVEGEARVFEGVFSWSLEDGHHILAMGVAHVEAGAPEWGKF